MNFFKRIDNYLLHYYPSIWITRVHSFLPIGIGIILLIYLANISVGWSPKDQYPRSEMFILIMIIPVLVYLVYWFVFQSRYNVSKSGGKMSYGAEYLNFFLYALVFTVAYFFILVVPYSNDMKMKYAVGQEEVWQDIDNLNKGNSLVNSYGSFEDLGNGNYKIWESEFVYDYREYNKYESTDEYSNGSIISRREALQRIDDYKESYNKYTRNTINKSAEELLADRIAGETSDDYYYYDYYDGSYAVERKVSMIRDLHEGRGRSFWGEPWFWRVSFGFILWLALVVWIFKQVNLRHFVFGLISVCLTPLLAGIVGAIIFGLLYTGYNGRMGEKMGVNLVLLAYAVVGFFFVRGYLQKTLNQTSYVLSMYFHFWLPILPGFIYLSVVIRRHYNYWAYGYSQPEVFGLKEEEFVYWMCVLVGLASIAIFKPIYAKFRSMPMSR